MTLRGVDVSSNNGPVDWAAAAAAGIQFAALKATEGGGATAYTNPLFLSEWAAAKAAGIRVIAYHYALPAWNAPQDEAAYFLSVVQSVMEPGDCIALDAETYQYGRTLPADCSQWALTWFETAEAPWPGLLGMLYTNLDCLQNHGLAAVGNTNRGLWLASPDNPTPAVPTPWTTLALVQTSWTGNVPGISGGVDLDQFLGDEAAFDKYGIPQPAPPPKPVWDAAAQLKLIGYVASGSGPSDIIAWCQQFV